MDIPLPPTKVSAWSACVITAALPSQKRDAGTIHPDIVAGVPDSGVAHAIGYANESGIPYSRPFIKYTPTWPRSFMPTMQSRRNLIAKMKLIPVHDLIQNRSLLLIDDSIVRGTQLRETTEFFIPKRCKRGTYPSRMSSPALWL